MRHEKVREKGSTTEWKGLFPHLGGGQLGAARTLLMDFPLLFFWLKRIIYICDIASKRKGERERQDNLMSVSGFRSWVLQESWCWQRLTNCAAVGWFFFSVFVQFLHFVFLGFSLLLLFSGLGPVRIVANYGGCFCLPLHYWLLPVSRREANGSRQRMLPLLPVTLLPC